MWVYCGGKKKKKDEGWTYHVVKCNVFPILGLNGSTPVFLLFLISTAPAARYCRTQRAWKTCERGGLTGNMCGKTEALFCLGFEKLMSWLQPAFLGQSMTNPLLCHRLVIFTKSVDIFGSWSAGQMIILP